jgi:pimeloyl-ACP methyl ester carboxylesterase
MKRLNIVIISIILAMVATGLSVDSVQAASDQQCQQVTRTVTLAPASPTPYQIVGWLCWQGNVNHQTVQLLQAGLSYDHNYWDWPQQPQKYSYVRAANESGYATFNIDRLGTGQSDHPVDPNTLTTESEAYVAHQLVQDLRSGSIGSVHFEKVIAVGHSFGSQVTAYEAATYGDVDGVILTGSLHDLTPETFTVIAPTFYPAQLDPKFAGSGLAPGYLTSMPGTRGTSFYNTTFADPEVIAQDEALKETGTGGELATITDGGAVTSQIQVPVLLTLGAQDLFFCHSSGDFSCAGSAAILARESSHFAPQACLEAYVQAESGHDINLHPTAHKGFEAALDWANSHIGKNATPPIKSCAD